MRLRTIIGGGAAVLFAVVSTVGCSSLRHLAESNPKAGISLPKHAKQDIDAAKAALANKKKNDSEIIVTTTDGKQRTFIPTENVSIDDDGNMLIDGQAIEAVTISARNKFRNLVERNGKISIEFIVTVPDTLLARDWQLVLNPMLIEGQGNTPYPLDPLVYRGDKFGRMQNHEYDSYEQQRNGLLGDLRRYVLTTDNIVARNITYTPDANDQFDHLKDYLAPRFRYDSIDVLPGGEIFTRVDGDYAPDAGRVREAYIRSLAGEHRRVASEVRRADAEQVRDYASQRVEWTNRKRPKVGALLYETDEAVVKENLTGARYYIAPRTKQDELFETEGSAVAAPEQQGSAVYRRTVRHPYFPNARLDTVVFRPDHKVDFYYLQTVEANENTDRIYVFLNGGIENMRGDHYTLRNSDTLDFKVRAAVMFLDERPRYKFRIVYRDAEENERFYFTFPSGKSKLDTTAANRANIRLVREKVRDLMLDPIYLIDSITLRATSSPEGTWTVNDRLARERAEVLRQVLLDEFRPLYDSLKIEKSVSLDDRGREVIVGGDDERLPDLPRLLRATHLAEDWDELARMVSRDTTLTEDKEALLSMINDREINADVREYRIRSKFPKAYAYMRSVLYPRMRAVDFRFNLHRKGMKKDTVHTKELDEDYMHALELMKKRRYEEALKIFQSRDEAIRDDRNIAIAYMSLGYSQAAYRVFAKQPDVDEAGDIQYMMAILSARMGDEQQAIQHFLKAGELKPMLKFQGNLEPELSFLIKKYGLDKDEFEDNF